MNLTQFAENLLEALGKKVDKNNWMERLENVLYALKHGKQKEEWMNWRTMQHEAFMEGVDYSSRVLVNPISHCPREIEFEKKRLEEDLIYFLDSLSGMLSSGELADGSLPFEGWPDPWGIFEKCKDFAERIAEEMSGENQGKQTDQQEARNATKPQYLEAGQDAAAPPEQPGENRRADRTPIIQKSTGVAKTKTKKKVKKRTDPKALTDKQKEAVDTYALCGSYTKAGEILGVDRTTVRQNVQAAQKKQPDILDKTKKADAEMRRAKKTQDYPHDKHGQVDIGTLDPDLENLLNS